MQDLAEKLRQGQGVAVVDVVDAPPDRPPWKFLERMGYGQARVAAVVRRFPMEPERRIGPFTVRWIRRLE